MLIRMRNRNKGIQILLHTSHDLSLTVPTRGIMISVSFPRERRLSEYHSWAGRHGGLGQQCLKDPVGEPSSPVKNGKLPISRFGLAREAISHPLLGSRIPYEILAVVDVVDTLVLLSHEEIKRRTGAEHLEPRLDDSQHHARSASCMI